MTLLLFFVLLLLPLSALAQSPTMWPVPHNDGTITYVPMGNGTPPQWMTPDGRGGHNVIPNWVPPAPTYSAPRYVSPPLTVPEMTPRSTYNDQAVHDRMMDYIESRGR